MSDCIFCKIVNGEFNTEFIYEDDTVAVFKDINPKMPVHLLVVPKKHIESLNFLEDEKLSGTLLQTVRKVCKKLGITDYKTLINTGKGAGQEVFHIHLHILAGGNFNL
ncbi:MAG: histidine triad nucleotide-binding protein [Candidatus Gastranaerophilales bacterium]|nr:histidine triad nucleotide-binding protein [Candidatus Gastranaerophilales bacterium]